MMIGIDLGTTFSVIAVPGRAKVSADYPQPRYLERCDVSIIPDPYGNYIIPSAVWEEPEAPGQVVVGAMAKQAADEGHSPILFSKRNIGTDILHPLGGRGLTARETAREILIYLKYIAEAALGEKIDQAVITHPAYFDLSMREETGLAALDAGFEFDREHHLLMEPAAAALAYTRSDSRDPLRLLVYDLGGGTFDVTVMVRQRGVITLKAFGGNRLLGGFNFDTELARWLLDRMKARGVEITIDASKPEQSGKWARLLRIAEDTKIRIAKAPTDRMPVRIKEQHIFEDDRGKPIALIDEITRAQFVSLISEMLAGTVAGSGAEGETKGCEATLAEVGWGVDQVDEILLVGGSSYGPWVSAAIRARWGREPQLFEPDLCVAAGAAVHAATLPVRAGGVELDAPRESVLQSVSVGGRVLAKSASAGGVNVQISRPGREWHAPVRADGNFLFPEVDLVPESVSTFQLVVVDAAGRVIARHQFEIAHASDSTAGGTSLLTVLPKPLYIETLGGMRPLAAEGVVLPAHCEVELTRVNEESSIEIRLFQEADPLASVVIRDVPATSTAGSKVKLAVDVSRNNRITGRATAFTRKGAVAAESPVDIRIPPLQVPSAEELRVEFASLEQERAERMELGRSAETRLLLEAKGDKLRRKIDRLLSGPAPDRQEIWLALRELRRIVHPAKDEMEPPLEEFERLLIRNRDLLAANPGDPQIQGHARMLERLEREGRAYHLKKDRKAWTQVNSTLESLRQRLEGAGRSGPKVAREPDPPYLQKVYARMHLDQARGLLRAREAELLDQGKLEISQAQVNRCRATIDQIESAIDEIGDNEDPKRTEARLAVARQKIERLLGDIPSIGYDLK